MSGHEFGVGRLVMNIVNLIWSSHGAESLELFFFFFLMALK